MKDVSSFSISVHLACMDMQVEESLATSWPDCALAGYMQQLSRLCIYWLSPLAILLSSLSVPSFLSNNYHPLSACQGYLTKWQSQQNCTRKMCFHKVPSYAKPCMVFTFPLYRVSGMMGAVWYPW